MYTVESNNDQDSSFTRDTCFEWCLSVDAEKGPDFVIGEEMCCDFEGWSDGTYECNLFGEGIVEDQDMDAYPDRVFMSNVFPHGYV